MAQDMTYCLQETKLKLCGNLYFNDLEELKNRNGELKLKSNVKSLDIRNYLKQPCTPHSELSCPRTKLALMQDFQEFKKCFNNTFNQNNVHKLSDEKTNQTSFKRSINHVENDNKDIHSSGFVTASEELNAQILNKYGYNKNAPSNSRSSSNFLVAQKRKLGLRNRGVNKKFISPVLSTNDSDNAYKSEDSDWPITYDNKYMKNIDPKMIEMIQCEIMDTGAAPISWNDIAGLQFAKSVIQEAVIWPILRPDIFNGLRRPPKGILLFGPPGTGKTLIGKCIATESKSTFFSISASSLTSKWVGDGEKMVRALFAVARSHQPSVIFIDEIDSLLSQRSDTEHESSRRMKTEFLVQLDGATTDNEERLLLVGATNRPQELDEAARRRFVKRLYVPLPEYEARLELLKKLISGENHLMTDNDFEAVARLSEGYSGADVRSLCAEASLGPIRSINMQFIEKIQAEEVRPLMMEDFEKAFIRVKSSVSPKDLEQFVEWNNIFGCGV